MTEETIALALATACLLGLGIAIVRYDNARQGAVAWATPVAWVSFSLSALFAIATVASAFIGDIRNL